MCEDALTPSPLSLSLPLYLEGGSRWSTARYLGGLLHNTVRPREHTLHEKVGAAARPTTTRIRDPRSSPILRTPPQTDLQCPRSTDARVSGGGDLGGERGEAGLRALSYTLQHGSPFVSFFSHASSYSTVEPANPPSCNTSPVPSRVLATSLRSTRSTQHGLSHVVAVVLALLALRRRGVRAPAAGGQGGRGRRR